MEIERKFKVAEVPKKLVDKGVYSHIMEWYIAIAGDEHVRVRVLRRMENGEQVGEVEYTLTHKEGTGLIRVEHEFPISADIFRGLLHAVFHEPVVKYRYAEGWTVYDQFLRGGDVIAEVEFTSVKDADRFKPPADWEEVTNNPEYYNVNRYVALS